MSRSESQGRLADAWMGHVTHTNTSCHSCGYESCHTCDWVMSHVWMSHVTHLNESCHVCAGFNDGVDQQMHEWVTAHTWIRHVAHMNESCHTYEWVISHMWPSLVTHMNESCHACAGVNDGVDQQALELQFAREHAKEAFKVCFICMCHMTHWYVWHDSFICVTWLISWHDSFMCVDMTHVCACTNAMERLLSCVSFKRAT